MVTVAKKDKYVSASGPSELDLKFDLNAELHTGGESAEDKAKTSVEFGPRSG